MKRNQVLVGALVCLVGVVGGVEASDREELKNNPYNVTEPFVPEVVIGVERTRAEPIKKEEADTSGARVPVEVKSPESKSKAVTVGNVNKVESAPVKVNTVNKVDADKVVSEVKQPQIVAAQRVLKGSPQEFLMVSKPNNRVFVSGADGKVYFKALSGKLRDNVEALLSVTDTHMPIVYSVSEQHLNTTDVWVYGDTVLDVLNALLVNYRDPHPIRANTYGNRVVEIVYDYKNR